jgi:hypothetical protein
MSRATSELAHLFRQLKAPAAARALPKLADRARAEEWSYEQFTAALLKTATDSRDSHGGQSRIKAARFQARKTIEEFDFAFQASLRRDTVLHLGQLDFLAGRENIVLLGPPGTGKTHCEQFRRRDLYDIHLAALFLDAVFLSVRPDGPEEGVLVAWGFSEDGERVMLGMRESHEDWLALGRDLIARGLGAPMLIVADGAPGLIKAVEQ